jgi:DNA-binding transcriptional MerR regulator
MLSWLNRRHGGGKNRRMRYRIGQFADLSGVSKKTLRFYDQIGLLRPCRTDVRTGYRLYTPEQLEHLAAIRALKELGASLREIREVIGHSVIGYQGVREDRRELLCRLRHNAEQSLHAAGRRLACIDVALSESNGATRLPQVVVKRCRGTRIASLRAKVNSYSEILPLERNLLASLPEESVGALRGVLWHRCEGEGVLEGEPFVELKRVVPRRSYYDLKELPPVAAACAYSGLEDEQAEGAYSAIRKWMKTRDYRLAGPKREIYWDNMLEIAFPLQSI